jgi:multisubunit Na+/H+ antiporter MnhG subunit
VPSGLRSALNLSDPTAVGLFFLILALGLYVFSNPSRYNLYNHFVLQADAYIHGTFAIPMPRFQDVMPLPDRPGFGIIPVPPLPALLLVPLVLAQGVPADQGLLAVVLGAINVGLCWRMLTRVTENSGANLLATLFFAFGTVHWYAAMLGSTWFFAHVVAITFLLLAITAALDGERQERARALVRQAGALVRGRGPIDPLQFLAGFVFGVAALARLTVIFGAPFFVVDGGGVSYCRRAF